MADVKRKAFDLCVETIEKLGYELIETKYDKQFDVMTLTFFIDTDKEGGISLDDCEAVSRAIDPLLDSADFLPDSYNLNVSSPGLDRPLTLERDFKKNNGKEIEISFYKQIDGKKKISGVLTAWSDADVTITVGSEQKTYNKKDISIIKPVIKF